MPADLNSVFFNGLSRVSMMRTGADMVSSKVMWLQHNTLVDIIALGQAIDAGLLLPLSDLIAARILKLESDLPTTLFDGDSDLLSKIPGQLLVEIGERHKVCIVAPN